MQEMTPEIVGIIGAVVGVLIVAIGALCGGLDDSVSNPLYGDPEDF